MFGWFEPKCPVEAGMKRWIEARIGWLLGQFDKKWTLEAPMILPNEEFYPDPFDGSEEAGRLLFERTCRYMHIDPDRVEVEFYRPERKGRFNASLLRQKPGWAGLYDESPESQKKIWIDKDLLEDAEGLVATFAHELAHAILLGEKRLPRDLPDMESVTDLATVVLGMGIFNANVSLRTQSYTAMRMHHWNISRIGYLAPETYGYALALLSWLREDEQPAWMRYLSVTISDPLKRGLAFLRKTDDDSVVEGESLDSISLCELFPGAARDSQTMDEDDRILEAEAREAEELETEEDRHYSDGFIYAESGQWAEAADAYSKVLERNPRDGETYQERAWAYLELGRVADAVADAEKAVKLLPDEMNAYLVRGTAYTQSKNFERGIADLNRYLEDVNNFIGEGTISSKAYYFRGLAYAGLNDFQRAVKDFSKAIIRYPQWAEPYEARAFAYEQLGKPGKAQKDREEAAYRAAK